MNSQETFKNFEKLHSFPIIWFSYTVINQGIMKIM